MSENPFKIRDGFIQDIDGNTAVNNRIIAYADFLNEAVAVSSHAIPWIKHEDRFIQFAIQSLYKRTAELVDAASICFRSGAFEPCKPFVRSLSEALIYIMYIRDSNSAFRSRSYVMSQDLNSLHAAERFDPSTKRGKEFFKEITSDAIGSNCDWVRVDTQQRRKELEIKWQSPELSGVWELWRGHEKKPWYSLDTGKTNLSALCRHLKIMYIYDIYYRFYSPYSHGNTRNDFDDRLRSYNLRSPHNAPIIFRCVHELWKLSTFMASGMMPQEQARVCVESIAVSKIAMEYFKNDKFEVDFVSS